MEANGPLGPLMASLLSRVQAGALLELAADGTRSHFYSSALPHWSLEAGAAPEDRLAMKGSVGVAEPVGSRAVQPRGRGGINNSVHPSAPNPECQILLLQRCLDVT